MAYGNGTSVGSLNGPSLAGMNTPQRQTVISEQMNILEGRIDLLAQLTSELDGRISGILMPEPPSPANQTSAPHPGVPLGAHLAQLNDRLGMVSERLRNIISRVEL